MLLFISMLYCLNEKGNIAILNITSNHWFFSPLYIHFNYVNSTLRIIFFGLRNPSWYKVALNSLLFRVKFD